MTVGKAREPHASVTRLAERFRTALEAAGAEGLDMTALRTVARSNAIPASRIRAALAVLHKAGQAAPTLTPTSGRPREVWRYVATSSTLPPHLARLVFPAPPEDAA